ncbi:hypothetical protein ABIC63_004818 [Pseudacidovorax sp. 1753]|uniref:P-loop NTPase fold protein n=1 Tax=Pseudacidovorax sp. 1753 TaxID=3156419 RepID=UPI0033939FF5
MKENDHIREFLKYYCNLPKSPGYAVLLSGSWGSGKTWFIKNFLGMHPEIEKHALYVSLYGVQSFDDIESEFFRLLHPVLGSKPVRILNRLLRGALKTTINFDLDSDGKNDGSVTGGIPNDRILDRVSLAAEKILIFDDLERSSIATTDILGYINQFTEQAGLKSIVIANEKELAKSQEDLNLSCNRIKEKTIGRSFEVVPELESALEAFSAELETTPLKSIIEENRALIIQAYEHSNYKNLRVLRHTLWDFARLLQELHFEALQLKQLTRDLLAIFMVYSFEVRTNTVAPQDLRRLIPDIFSHIYSKQREVDPNKPFHDIYKKYSGLNLYPELIKTSTWEKFFSTGSVPSSEINESIRNSKYFQKEQQPSWVKLWHGMGLSDVDFEKVLIEVQGDWDSRVFCSAGEIAHVVGLFIKFSKNGIYQKSVSNIISEAQGYIDDFWSKLDISEFYPGARSTGLEVDAYAGLGFASSDDDDFRGFLRYIEESRSRTFKGHLPAQAAELLQLMTTDTRLFCQRILHSNSEENIYYRTPILHLIAPEDFINKFMNGSSDDRNQIGFALKERYAHDMFNSDLTIEKDWLSAINKLLKAEMIQRAGKISSLNIKALLPYIEEALSNLPDIQHS